MKKYIVIIALIFFSSNIFAQDFSKLKKIKLEELIDYSKNESLVLQCANYILNTPYSTNDNGELNRLNAVSFIIRWMEGTDKYTFDITTELTKGKMELMVVQFAAMAKVAIEETNQKLSSSEILHKANELLIAYCANPKNNIKATKAIKKAIKKRK